MRGFCWCPAAIHDGSPIARFAAAWAGMQCAAAETLWPPMPCISCFFPRGICDDLVAAVVLDFIKMVAVRNANPMYEEVHCLRIEKENSKILTCQRWLFSLSPASRSPVTDAPENLVKCVAVPSMEAPSPLPLWQLLRSHWTYSLLQLNPAAPGEV